MSCWHFGSTLVSNTRGDRFEPFHCNDKYFCQRIQWKHLGKTPLQWKKCNRSKKHSWRSSISYYRVHIIIMRFLEMENSANSISFGLLINWSDTDQSIDQLISILITLVITIWWKISVQPEHFKISQGVVCWSWPLNIVPQWSHIFHVLYFWLAHSTSRSSYIYCRHQVHDPTKLCIYTQNSSQNIPHFIC